ncbi:MAG: aldehyde dehydrogenase [Rhodospirillaceae bacterium]|nr:aldehyde dehydrogenase [Rhodospirillaceae bacterium]
MSIDKNKLYQKFKINPYATGYANGKHVGKKENGFEIQITSPIDEEIISTLREDSAEDVEQIVSAARRAFDTGPWSGMSVDQRKTIMYEISNILRANAEELAFLETINSGLTMSHVEHFHVVRTAFNFEFFADVAGQARGESYSQTQPYLSVVTQEPVGVAALIGPWNAPLALCSMKIASCIAFGNTCVLKPSEYTPLSLLRVIELIHETNIPKGVVNLVNGRGHITGEALVRHPDIDVVSFTGGTVTGSSIAAAAGDGLKAVALELGGKSANIITKSANLERALDGALLGIYSNNGQQCLAGSRIILENSIADEFIEKFVQRSKNINVGNPLDPLTEIGPVCYQKHMERILSYSETARMDGDEILTGGVRDNNHPTGLYLQPTAVLAKTNASRVCQEEIFGPFVSFLTFNDLEESIAIANDSDFGLVGYVWSEHLPTITKVSQGIRAGTIWVNTPMTRELRAPFGGFKKSGIGRDSAQDCMDFFTEKKTVTIPLTDFSMPKWGTQNNKN